MTPRPYAPETRSVPLTFMDCPDSYCYANHKGEAITDPICRHSAHDCWKDVYINKNCKRGFAP
jgi:hypothetical protein